MAKTYKLLSLLLLLVPLPTAFGQPKGPQPWWPVQPKALPFVHSLFTDDMVVQRDMAAPLWGWSKPGDTIVITVDGKPSGQPASAGVDGKWLAKIGPFAAGGPHVVTIAGSKQQATLHNVLFGDVWLCSGQSNMNWPVRLSVNGELEVKKADYPQIRSFNVSFYSALVPMKTPPPARWEVCKPEFARNFTGVGYFFARAIHKTQQIPIGILHSSAGATYGEVWVSPDALRKHMPQDFQKELAAARQAAGDNAAQYDYFAAIEKWCGVVDPASARLKYAADPALDTAGWRDLAVPKPWQEAGLPDFNGLVWFRHWLDVPEAWAGKDLKLHLSSINDTDVVWLNGTLLGCTQIKGSARSYLVEGKLVKAGKNLLAVLVMNAEGPGGFCSAPANMVLLPVSPGADKPLRLAGVWKATATVRSKDLTVPFPTPKVGHYQTMNGMYHGMIAPLEPFGIKGALWYQGEANGPRWLQYRRLLPTLIADWRERFPSPPFPPDAKAGMGGFPFLIVALPNYNPLQKLPVEPGWAEIRESQWRTVRTVPNTGLATTIDIGEAQDIHPRNKQEVGRRLALTARHLVYGEKQLVYSGPEYTGMKLEGARIRLHFKHVGGGLMIRQGEPKLTGFAIAGADKKFVWADAVIDGDTIVVSSPEVAQPRHVRYGWAWNPLVNLYNREGLPAITFRTDE